MLEEFSKVETVLSELEREALALFPMNEKKSIFLTEKMDKYRQAILDLKEKGYLQDVGMLTHPQSAFWVLKRVK